MLNSNKWAVCLNDDTVDENKSADVHTAAAELNNVCLGRLSPFDCNELARLRGGAWGWGMVRSADVDTLVGRAAAGT